MTDIELGWLAGIIDGEGTVTLVKRSKKKFRYPVVSVASTDLEILNEVKRTAGGCIVCKGEKRPGVKQSWFIVINGGLKVVALLRQVSPYLKCPKKRHRVEFILENYPKLVKRNGYYSNEEEDRKRKFEDEFFKLL